MKMSPWKWVGGCRCDAKPGAHPADYPHGHLENVETGGRMSLKIRSVVQGMYLLKNNAGFEGEDTSAIEAGMRADYLTVKLPMVEVGEQADIVDLMGQCLQFGIRTTITNAARPAL